MISRYDAINRQLQLIKMFAWPFEWKSGELKIPTHIRILHVEQEVNGDDTLAIESVLECDVRRQTLLQQEKDISEKLQLDEFKNDTNLCAELQKVYIDLEAIEADKAVSKAAKILSGLGFSSNDQKKPTKGLSKNHRLFPVNLL